MKDGPGQRNVPPASTGCSAWRVARPQTSADAGEPSAASLPIRGTCRRGGGLRQDGLDVASKTHHTRLGKCPKRNFPDCAAWTKALCSYRGQAADYCTYPPYLLKAISPFTKDHSPVSAVLHCSLLHAGGS